VDCGRDKGDRAAIQAALSKAKSPEAEAADAAKPAALLLSPQERLEIVKSLTSVIPAGLDAALSKTRKGREKLKSELLTGNEYLRRRAEAEEAKEAEEAAVAGRAAERAAAKVAKAAAKVAAAEERASAKAAKAAAKAAAAKPGKPPPKAAPKAPKRKASSQPPPASVSGSKGYGARPLPKRFRKE
jgi:histone H1/5